MEIRAIISLAVAKFVANAKTAADSFKLISGSAEASSKNIDKLIQKNLDQTKSAGIERVADQSKVGRAILAQEQKLADDRRSVIMAGVRRVEKDRSKLELDAISKGGTGEVTGAIRPGRQRNPAHAKERDESKVLTVEMIKDINKRFDAKQRVEKKATALITREYTKATREIEKQNSRASRSTNSHYSSVEKAAAKAARSQIAEARRVAKDGTFTAKIELFQSPDFDRKLASTRYALYDIGQRAIAAGTALAVGIAAVVKSAVAFESAFTSVERTTGISISSNIPEVRDQAIELRKSLIDMSTEIPVAFADITEIATLGAQLGIATDQVDDFTETVAKFSAITKISVEDVALSFGRLSQLLKVPSTQFENLSSAIAFTGVNSVSTDKEILRMAESIAATATQAGFAADETIGLAAALASLKIRPEEARGVLIRLFRELTLSVSQAGPALDDLAAVIGKTSEEAASIWKQDPSAFFQSFLEGARASGELDKTITALGITNSRELRVIQTLAGNLDVLSSTMADSAEQFQLGTFSSEAYGLVSDDVASKIIKLQNAVAALGASFGEVLLPVLGPLLDGLTSFSKTLANSPSEIKTLVGVLVAGAAGLALFFGGLAFGIAGLLAMKLAFQNLKGETVSAGLGIATFRALLISLLPPAAKVTSITGALGFAARSAGTSFMAASVGAKIFTASLGIVGAVFTAISAVALFAQMQRDSTEAAEDLAKANLEVAGGIDAFRQASADGRESGSRIYSNATISVKQLSKEQIEATRVENEARVARLALTTSTDKGKEAYENALATAKLFNDEIERGGKVTQQSTIDFNDNTKEIIANALAKIQVEGEESPLNIYKTIGEMPQEVKDRLAKNGVDAVELLNKAIEAAMSGTGSARDVIGDALNEIRFEDPFGVIFDQDYNKVEDDLVNVGKSIDSMLGSARAGETELETLNKLLGKTGTAADDADGEVVDLNDTLRNTIKALTTNNLSENKAADALDTFAQSAKETGGELEGMGEAARVNLSNFASFMDAATEAAIAAGEGTPGAIRRIIGGLEALDAAGVNTKAAFGLVRDNILGSIISMGNGSVEFRAEIAKAYDLSSLKELIKGFYEARIAMAASPDEFRLLRDQMNRSLAGLNGASFDIKPFTSTTKAAEKTLTALEKLQATIAKLFKASNNRLDVLNSVDSLGEALKKNGRVFSVWTKAGRDNISSLRSTLNTLAESSNGNTQVFANSLGALRQALVRAGVSGTGLKDIDNLIKKTGKTSKVSKNQVTQFYAQIKSSSEARRALLEIADAASKVSSAINAGLSATFAQGNAIDQVTLGWLDLADAQDAARKAVSGANEAIVEANLSIRAAKASIDELTADSGKLQFQLQIAIKYGDTLREDAIRAQLGTIDAEIASKENDITKANSSIANSVQEITDANSKLGIQSNTRDLIAQNLALQDMAGRYGAVAAFMLATAKPGTDLNGIINSQVKAFHDNAIQMGYTETDAKTLSDVLRTELIASMDDIPEDIATTIKADTTGALSAVTRFANDANARLATIKDKTVTVTTIERTVSQSSQGSFKGRPVNFYRGGLVSGPGGATSDSIPARLSNGEFVVRASAVSRHGVDFFNSLNNMQSAPSRMLAAPAQSSGGSQTVFLSTEDRQLLRSAINRPVALYTDNATIAKSANDGNAILAQRGIR